MQGQLLERSKALCKVCAFGSFRHPLGNMTFDSPRLPKCCAPFLQLPSKSQPVRASCFCTRALVEDKYSVTVVSNLWRHPSLKPATVFIHLYGKVPCLNLHWNDHPSSLEVQERQLVLPKRTSKAGLQSYFGAGASSHSDVVVIVDGQ